MTDLAGNGSPAPTGVLLMAYGTPATLDEVEPYYTHIRGGRPPDPAKLAELKERYRRVGGRTPLREITQQTAERLERRLDAASPGAYRVFIGMKHWHPFIGDALPQIAAAGIRRLVAIPLAPHYSRLSIGGYRRAVEEANARLAEPLEIVFVESWHAEPGFRRLIAERIAAAVRRGHPLPPPPVVLFSAHSLPERILTWNDPYPEELRVSAAAIAALAGVSRWRFAYQSAGMTGEPWLGPDILDALDALAAEGVRSVLSVPFGFVCDHLEILYDIDHECRARAAKLGLTFGRIRLPNADPEFVAVLADIVARGVAALRSAEAGRGTGAAPAAAGPAAAGGPVLTILARPAGQRAG